MKEAVIKSDSSLPRIFKSMRFFLLSLGITESFPARSLS